MKLKDAFLAVCLLALLVSEVLLFLANQQKQAALARMSQAQHDAQQASAALNTLKAANSAAQLEGNSTLRADYKNLAQKLAALESQNEQLRQTNHALARYAAAARDMLDQQQQQLDQFQQGSDKLALQEQAACIANLREIQIAKAAWALQNHKNLADVPTEDDLLPYLPNGVFPACPAGGSYAVGAVGDPPACSIPGHVLPQSQ
ncbi:MAG: hypothetical protein KGR98_01925 [Verrucomicrobia bacterium]|nr:hypothetical protein [Verrucomicrobiota bacterium]MDE3098220.1 hypothetical protein [Verrucomicrobiota bacterium]